MILDKKFIFGQKLIGHKIFENMVSETPNSKKIFDLFV